MTKRSTDLPRLSWAEVCARRLDRHSLAAPAPDAGPAEVVAAMCGAHAQVLSAAELSVGLRLAGGARTDVRHAVSSERSLVKTFGPRGTIHLLPTRDLPMWTGALSAVPPMTNPLAAQARLTPGQTDDVVAAVTAALADAELTIDELSAEVVARTGPWAADPVMPAFAGRWPRWRQAIHLAAQRGALCFGPNRGRNVTYTSPQRWFPGFQPMAAPEALAALVRRYLHAYGPATSAHFAQWLAAPRGWAADLFASLAGRLEQVQVDGLPAWVASGDTTPPPTPRRTVRLLPYFDAYAVGCHPRELLFPGAARQRALSGGQAGNFPVLLIDGTVAGVWHVRRSGRKLAVTVEPLAPLAAARRRDLEKQVERIGEILEGTPTLTIGPVTVGGHA